MGFLEKNDRVFVAGSGGMVGSAICNSLEANGYKSENGLLIKSSRKEIDLKDYNKLEKFFDLTRPNIVVIAAAKVGGILANQNNPVDFLLENLQIQNNLIEISWKFGIKRLLFLGSSCIYPKYAAQPIKEKYLLGDKLESSNQWYAIAKIAGLKLCEAYRTQYKFDAISLMPTNLYGPKDNYHYNDSHVMAALIRKFYEAKLNKESVVKCWGSGKPLREFLHVSDFAEACLIVLKKWSPDKNNAPLDDNGEIINYLNVGSGYEISIKELSETISEIIGFKGNILWDKTKPDGTPRKRLDNEYIKKLGWYPKINLKMGIRQTLKDFEKEYKNSILKI